MDSIKVGALIRRLRKEQGMTQQELADKMRLSDRTISKWERGAGCPDISVLHELSEVLGINIEKLLSGSLSPRQLDGGNMKTACFYHCAECGNVLFSSSAAELSCCGRKMAALSPATQGAPEIRIEAVEYDYFITVAHPMSKEDYLSFAALLSYDRMLLVKLYPEQSAEIRIPQMRGRLYLHSVKKGLFAYEI